MPRPRRSAAAEAMRKVRSHAEAYREASASDLATPSPPDGDEEEPAAVSRGGRSSRRTRGKARARAVESSDGDSSDEFREPEESPSDDGGAQDEGDDDDDDDDAWEDARQPDQESGSRGPRNGASKSRRETGAASTARTGQLQPVARKRTRVVPAESDPNAGLEGTRVAQLKAVRRPPRSAARASDVGAAGTTNPHSFAALWSERIGAAAGTVEAEGVRGKTTRPRTATSGKLYISAHALNAAWKPEVTFGLERSGPFPFPASDERGGQATPQSAWQRIDRATLVKSLERSPFAHLPLAGAMYDHGWWPGKRYTLEEEESASELAEAVYAKRTGASAKPQAPREDIRTHQQEVGAPYFLAPGAHTVLLEHEAKVYHEATTPESVGAPSRYLHPPSSPYDVDSGDQDDALRRAAQFLQFNEVLPPDVGKSLRLSVGADPDKQEEIVIPKGRSFDLGAKLPAFDPCHPRYTHVANAGGHIYSVAFAPSAIHLEQPREYLAVSCSKRSFPRTKIGITTAPAAEGSDEDRRACLQIWAYSAVRGADDQRGAEAGLAMGVCHELGPAWQIEWCPCGYDYRRSSGRNGSPPRRLGLLAGAFMAGVVAVFAVPHPEDVRARQKAADAGKDGDTAVYIRAQPTLKLSVPGTVPLRIRWAGGERLAAGFSNGWVAVWNVRELLCSGADSGAPSHYFPTTGSPILSLSWQMLPPIDARTGEFQTNSLPHVLLLGTYLGDTLLVDIDDPFTLETLSVFRLPSTASVLQPQTGVWLTDSEGKGVRQISNRPEHFGSRTAVERHFGTATSLSVSAFHPWLASGSQDGRVRVTNLRWATVPRGARSTSTLFRIDVERASGRLRMVDGIAPSVLTEKETREAAQLAWHPSIEVTSVAWSPNGARAALLAAGTACGALRVEWAATTATTTTATEAT